MDINKFCGISEKVNDIFFLWVNYDGTEKVQQNTLLTSVEVKVRHEACRLTRSYKDKV